jgi:hypothetical protein
MKPKKWRFWIELLAVVAGIACVLAVFFGTVAASSGSSAPSTQQSGQGLGSDGHVAETQGFDSPNSGAQTGNPQPDLQPVAVQTVAVQTYEGVVTDTRCGAKHTPAVPESAADCTRACVHAGEHFALVDGEKVYVLEGETELLKRAAGERVTLAGTLNGHTISVTSVRLP